MGLLWMTCKHSEADMDGVYCKSGHGDGYCRCKAYTTDNCPYYESEIRSTTEEKSEGWISVGDRLPEVSGPYLVVARGECISVLRYSVKHRLFNAFDELDAKHSKTHAITVTHWMPLPELPKTEE